MDDTEERQKLKELLAQLPFSERMRILEPILEARRKLDATMTEPMTMAQFEQLLFDWNG